MRRLPRSFFARPTLDVAPELLGKLLLRRCHGKTVAGRITEVEAYRGEDDRACHASRGRTPRTEMLYARPGTAYVYLIYGMYHCLNVVTEQEGLPAAVLIRSCAPPDDDGVASRKQAARKTSTLHSPRTSMVGPGRLCRALAISRVHNGLDLTNNDDLWIADDGYRVPPRDIATSPRIGIDYAGACAAWPWRFFLSDRVHVSPAPRG